MVVRSPAVFNRWAAQPASHISTDTTGHKVSRWPRGGASVLAGLTCTRKDLPDRHEAFMRVLNRAGAATGAAGSAVRGVIAAVGRWPAATFSARFCRRFLSCFGFSDRQVSGDLF